MSWLNPVIFFYRIVPEVADVDLGLEEEEFGKSKLGIPGERNIYARGDCSGSGTACGPYHTFGEMAEQ